MTSHTKGNTTPEKGKTVTDVDATPAKRKLIFKSPASKAAKTQLGEGHRIELKTDAYFAPIGQSQFERDGVGFRGGDSQDNLSFLAINHLPNWDLSQSGIPGFDEIKLADLELLEQVIKTATAEEGTSDLSIVAIQVLKSHAEKAGIYKKYAEAFKSAMQSAHEVEYKTPEQNSADYRGKKELLANSAPTDIDVASQEWAALTEYDDKLQAAVKKFGAVWGQYRAAAPTSRPKLSEKYDLDNVPADHLARMLTQLTPELADLQEYDAKLHALVKKYKAVWGEYPAVQAVKREVEEFEPANNHLDGVLGPHREYFPGQDAADAKLVYLVANSGMEEAVTVPTKSTAGKKVQTPSHKNSFPESLSALAPYLKRIAELKEGDEFTLNTKTPGKTKTKKVDAALKQDLTKQVLEHARDLAEQKFVDSKDKTALITGLEKLAKVLNNLIDKGTDKKIAAVVKEVVLDKLPFNPSQLASILVQLTEADVTHKMRTLIVEKAELGNYTAFEAALGPKKSYIAQIKEDRTAWQKPTSHNHKSPVTKDDLSREHSYQHNDSVHDRSITMPFVTKDGILIRENVGHFGTAREEAEYFNARKGLWKSALSGKIPGLKDLEEVDLVLLQTTVDTILATGAWPSGEDAIENLLVQVMNQLPDSLEAMLLKLPAGWESDISKMEKLFERAKELTNSPRGEETYGSYLTAKTMNYRDKGKTIIEELYVFTIHQIDESAEKDALLLKMEAELPALAKDKSLATKSQDEEVFVAEATNAKVDPEAIIAVGPAEEDEFDAQSHSDIGNSITPPSPARSRADSEKSVASSASRLSEDSALAPEGDVQDLLRSLTEMSSREIAVLGDGKTSMVITFQDLLKLTTIVAQTAPDTTGKRDSVLSDSGAGSSDGKTESARHSIVSDTEDVGDQHPVLVSALSKIAFGVDLKLAPRSCAQEVDTGALGDNVTDTLDQF